MLSLDDVIASGEAAHVKVATILQDREGGVKSAATEISDADLMGLINDAYIAKKASAVAILLGTDDVAKVAQAVADIPVAELVAEIYSA